MRLSPSERLILGTCRTRNDMFAVGRAARRELANPGSGNQARFGFGNMLRYVLIVGFVRQPVLYFIGPIIAVVCYLIVIYGLFK